MRSLGILGVGLAAVLALPAAFAQQSPSLLPPAATKEQQAAVPTVPQPPASPQLARADIEAWLDGYMPYAIKTGDIAGAVVVIVKDGQVLAERGYGYADVAKRTPVDPQLTLFRPGSVSKLVTWTAVMQLVEQGKLDLDRDVNTYLDFKIPPRDGKPVTLRNIMTHTGGFEEAVKNIMFYDPAKLASLGDYLKAWTPTRIFAPGTTPAYSNYATALAGYIVERVSGQSFDDYVDRNIFAPLGMDHSSFRQPLPKRLAATMSKGYTLGSGDASKYEIVGPAPAGSLASTGADMARFMITHLEQGELDGKRILQPDTIRTMHDSPLTLLPPLNRMQLGFFETNINDREVIAHLGDTQDFHTSLHLFLAERTGLYVSFNSAGKEGASGSLRTALFEDFADRYFPGKAPASRIPAKQAAEHARMLSGTWSSTRRSDTTFFNLFELLGQLKVGVGPKG
ncbi:MAG: beta-lactamase family protein, partial [Luteimonas sp.]|nr:beta-lactamase family protein [Luteimonas sp.]